MFSLTNDHTNQIKIFKYIFIIMLWKHNNEMIFFFFKLTILKVGKVADRAHSDGWYGLLRPF